MQLSLSFADWLAIAVIALPLLGKLLTELAGYLESRKQNSLGRIVGMAGRQAATIAATLVSLPSGATPREVETGLLRQAATDIMAEMGSSAAAAGANADKVQGVVAGELAKLKLLAPGPATYPVRGAIPVTGFPGPSAVS